MKTTQQIYNIIGELLSKGEVDWQKKWIPFSEHKAEIKEIKKHMDNMMTTKDEKWSKRLKEVEADRVHKGEMCFLLQEKIKNQKKEIKRLKDEKRL